ncbi:MAG: type II secretion system F family protein [Candidatus Diapherotrites archaeon]|uniref:Type II secretion system F family protein n=1 Tax=Candidatus Iainarchaeum sp. TaxID=3101447 RepID=A0A7J4IT75_9ARCH|nr:MAG: hypothetical protein QT03_C0001G1008 [archaeon GW2011_AR10]MBS3058807.1 type II secretion system F family protein [Candidatus Diapherotrites archaeon]HIH07944.1 type II secretion system F family protein [Candidatus Diapherotrites archaeon]
MRVRFLLFSIGFSKSIGQRLPWLGGFLAKIFYGLKYDLKKAELEIEAEHYLVAALLSALVYGLVGFLFFNSVLYLKDSEFLQENILLSVLIGAVFFAIFFFLHLVYPRIISYQVASGIDQSLTFAVKSMLIQVTSGISLYDAMINVSKSNYGVVSEEFKGVIRDINSGTPETRALEKLALKTKSEYLKKTSWQLLSSLRSGASLSGALNTVVDSLTAAQQRAIKNYAAELNLWILLYLLFAAAIPTLGITFFVILSALGGSSIGPEIISLIVGLGIVFQVVLIGFVRTRIPKVYL